MARWELESRNLPQQELANFQHVQLEIKSDIAPLCWAVYSFKMFF